MPIRFTIVALIVALCAIPAYAQRGPFDPDANGILPQPHVALTNTHVVDVRTGNILRDAVVVVRDGKIQSVTTARPPADALVIDLEGKYLLPGFMDGHWHGRTLENLRRAVESGVTTMKSASVGGYTDVIMRDLVKKGYVAGPDILSAGVYVNTPMGQAALSDPRLHKFLNLPVKGVEAVREVVRINADRGVDWIKTRSGGTTSGPQGPDPMREVYSEDELRAIVDEARAHNLKVECHSHGKHVVMTAIRAGCATIEHGSYLDEEALRLMKEKGTVWDPTYTSVLGFLLPFGDYDSSAAMLRGPYIVHNMQRMLRKGIEMGVLIITATDTQYGPKSDTRISREITNFVEFGMTPLQALQSATIVSAKVYGLESRTGAIEPGLEADLLAVGGNPLEDIWMVHEPMFVMSNGRLVYHRTLTEKGYIAPKVEWTGFGTGGPLP